ncbi:MAG: SDR family oxidoreductase [Acidobacteriota bacterium]|nr:MAG: SDR family oxidoreductase [Acidobacteriota bacterium]
MSSLPNGHASPDGVYIVTGASGGIGSTLARRLAARGARVVLAGRRRDALEELARELGAPAKHLDATRFDDVDRCVAETADELGRVDGLAHCVGSMLLKPAHLTTAEELREVMETNLVSAFAAVRAAVRAMRQEGGSIVLVSSAAARLGMGSHEAIAAAKAGIIGLTLSAAATYAARGIRVNAVAPGLVRTPMTEKITSNDKMLAASQALHALGRIGEPDDVAALIEFLLATESGWITGQVFGVDGGLASVRTRASR